MAAAKEKTSPRSGMPFTRLFIWRHPEVVGSYEGRFWGHSDVGLTVRGKAQVNTIAKRMSAEKLSAVYCSDLQRARLAAEAVGRAQRPRQKPSPRPEFRELGLGDWEGMTYEEIHKKYPNELSQRQEDLASFRIYGGESLTDLAERVLPAFAELVASHPGGRICLITHAGVIRVILTEIMGAPLDRVFCLDQEYAALNIVDVFEDGLPLIRVMNQTFD
jgi:alpha-ribazole phosphatase